MEMDKRIGPADSHDGPRVPGARPRVDSGLLLDHIMTNTLSNIGLEPENRPATLFVFLLLMIPAGIIGWTMGAPTAGTLPFTLVISVASSIAGALIGILLGITGWALMGGLRDMLLYMGLGSSMWVAFFTAVGLGVGAMYLPLAIFVLVLFVQGWRPSFPIVGTVHLSDVLATGWVLVGVATCAYAWSTVEGGTSALVLCLSGAVAGSLILAAIGLLTTWIKWVQEQVNTTRWWHRKNANCWVATGAFIGIVLMPITLLPSVIFGISMNDLVFELALGPAGVLAGVFAGVLFALLGVVLSRSYHALRGTRS